MARSVRAGSPVVAVAAAMAVSALVVTGLTAPAHAASRTVSDPKRDTQIVSGKGRTVADIRKVKITNGKKRVTVRVTFRKLTKKNWTRLKLQLNSNGGYGDSLIEVTPKTKKNKRFTVRIVGDAPGDVLCRARITTTKKYGKKGWVQVSAPKKCFAADSGKTGAIHRAFVSVTSAKGRRSSWDYVEFRKRVPR